MPEPQPMAISGVTLNVWVVDTAPAVTSCSPATLGGTSKASWNALSSLAVATTISLPSYLTGTFPGGKLVPLTVTFVPTGPAAVSMTTSGSTLNCTPLVAFVATSFRITWYSPLSEVGTTNESLTFCRVAFPTAMGFVRGLFQWM